MVKAGELTTKILLRVPTKEDTGSGGKKITGWTETSMWARSDQAVVQSYTILISRAGPAAREP
jgi:hypothetical protein